MPQTSGTPSQGLPLWISQTARESIVDADVVLWHTFGITHFPAPEDFPVMPAEPMSVLLRPRGFFERNPALDVRPSGARTPGMVLAKAEGRMGEEGGRGGV